MATLQLLMKESDELKLLGPRIKGRKTAAVADAITQTVLDGYSVPDDLPKEDNLVRSHIALPTPIMEHLEQLSKQSGRSICVIVRNMLGLNY